MTSTSQPQQTLEQLREENIKLRKAVDSAVKIQELQKERVTVSRLKFLVSMVRLMWQLLLS